MLVMVYAPRLCHKPEVLNETPYTKASSLTTPILIVAGFVVFVTALALIYASYHGAAWGERDQERGLNNRQQIASPVFHRYISSQIRWDGQVQLGQMFAIASVSSLRPQQVMGSGLGHWTHARSQMEVIAYQGRMSLSLLPAEIQPSPLRHKAVMTIEAMVLTSHKLSMLTMVKMWLTAGV